MSRRRAAMTHDEIARAREQDRLRQARRRKGSARGEVLVRLPADIADELGDDENAAARAVEILRRYVARMRDGA